MLDVRIGSGGMTGKSTGGAKVTLRDGWLPPNKAGWENLTGAVAKAGGLGKEAKVGAGIDDGVLIYMVAIDGGGIALGGAGL